MDILLAEKQLINAGRVRCHDCRGAGRDGGNVCWTCDGFGEFAQSAPEDDAPEIDYVATQGPDVLDEGGDLDRLLKAQRKAWKDSDCEIAVWERSGGEVVRLAALLRPGKRGLEAVRV